MSMGTPGNAMVVNWMMRFPALATAAVAAVVTTVAGPAIVAPAPKETVVNVITVPAPKPAVKASAPLPVLKKLKE